MRLEEGQRAEAESQRQNQLRLEERQRAETERQRVEAERNRVAKQRDKTAADKMQIIAKNFSKTITPAQTSGGLDFDGPAGENPPSRAGLEFLPGDSPAARSASSPAKRPLEFGDLTTTGDAFGTQKSNPKLTPAEAPTIGSNTKAGDQLKSAAAQAARGGDLTINYDVGGARNAGSFVITDPKTFSDRIKNDPGMKPELKKLGDLQAKRTQLDAELKQLTNDRNSAKDPEKMKELTIKLDQKSKDKLANLLVLSKQEQVVEKAKRIIENKVEDDPPPPQANSTPQGK